jgi:hypothetical protein
MAFTCMGATRIFFGGRKAENLYLNWFRFLTNFSRVFKTEE